MRLGEPAAGLEQVPVAGAARDAPERRGLIPAPGPPQPLLREAVARRGDGFGLGVDGHDPDGDPKGRQDACEGADGLAAPPQVAQALVSQGRYHSGGHVGQVRATGQEQRVAHDAG